MQTPAALVRKATLLVLLLVIAWSPVARAHGDLVSTIPKQDSKLKKPPDHLIINFTEPPAKGSVVTVRDGCRDDVVDELDFEERVGHVFLSEGRPGDWKVSYKVISAADGHKTAGSYSLTVAGKADCSEKPPKDEPPKDNGSGEGPQATGDGGDDDESSFPVVPVALGSLGVIALALVARRLSG